MSNKITIQGITLNVEKSVSTEIKNYIQELNNNYQGDVLNDIKNSLVEKLLEITKTRNITQNDLINIKNQIGGTPKSIYKRFFRQQGILGGVAKGISNYFNISVYIPRLIFTFPLIVLGLTILEFILIITISEQLLYLNIPLIFLKNINDGYTFSDLTNFILDRSDWFILSYIAAWIFVPKAKTKNEIAEINGKDIEKEELYLAILNKITYQNSITRNILAKVLFVIASIGIFIFDVLVSILNNIFSSLFFKFLIFSILIWGIFIIISFAITSFLVINL